MSFHFNFDALKNDNIDFPPDFMKSVYEHGDDSDLRIVLPGWRKFSDIEKSEIHFSADSKLLDKQRIYRYRSYARKFVRDLATENDLKELREMIDERLNNN